ncbi:hypothetical protein ELI20_18860 [Rhizobium ruizarguesonis]|uniref:hypothetical protein n=1 Tax=Rhizobium ruizarguesonis TaxID=2081791 RepID=UPI0010319932|nr:hypothetical protein [Rhizobium ruizarguesonis]TAW23119.1 hypothetical protein ELI20_18860 [Rhizobium ruizarguesonis]
MLRVLVTVAVMVFVSQTGEAALAAQDEVTISQIVKNDDGQGKLGLVLAGSGQAYMWANSELEFGRHTAPLFCPPKKLGITSAQHIAIIKGYIGRNPKAGEQAASSIIGVQLDALIETFPCDQ